jgi:ferritin-like metal-binding protein YciE
METEVRELLTEELKDTHSAEKQALRCMQKALRKATTQALRDGISLHIDQTQAQIERVEQAMEKLGSRPGRKVCEAMRGLVEEAQHSIEEHNKGPVLDLVIVAGMQRIEHYEIAAYGTKHRPRYGAGRERGRRPVGEDSRRRKTDGRKAHRSHPTPYHWRRDERGPRKWWFRLSQGKITAASLKVAYPHHDIQP